MSETTDVSPQSLPLLKYIIQVSNSGWHSREPIWDNVAICRTFEQALELVTSYHRATRGESTAGYRIVLSQIRMPGFE
jgi:hypothetical protein